MGYVESDLRRLCRSGGLDLIVEDDGRVLYAYVLDERKGIVGDLWLANRHPSPDAPPWKTGAAPPYLNPEECLTGAEVAAVTDLGRYSAAYDSDEGRFILYIDETPIGALGPGDKPGWSRCVGADGPLARRWA
ncbi:MAG: hypothetical protein AAFX03_09500 [Pseudomonadota bacterium]